jgi:hypothetical protein
MDPFESIELAVQQWKNYVNKNHPMPEQPPPPIEEE